MPIPDSRIEPRQFPPLDYANDDDLYDPDEAAVDAFRAELHDGLIWLGAGAVAGSLFTVCVAWLLSTWVL